MLDVPHSPAENAGSFALTFLIGIQTFWIFNSQKQDYFNFSNILSASSYATL